MKYENWLSKLSLQDSTNIIRGKGNKKILKFESWSKKLKIPQISKENKRRRKIKFWAGNERKISGTRERKGIWLWMNDLNRPTRWLQMELQESKYILQPTKWISIYGFL